MHCFGRAITVCPEEGFSKYMYMGQLHEGLEGLQFFQKGVELMIKERDGEQVSLSHYTLSTVIQSKKIFNLQKLLM